MIPLSTAEPAGGERSAAPIENTELPQSAAPVPIADPGQETAPSHEVAAPRLIEPTLVRPSEEFQRLVVYRSASRWAFGLFLALATTVAVLPVILRVSAREDLLKGKPWRTSSTHAVCHPENIECGGGRTSILFHTLEEPQPWIEFDFGAPTSFREVLVYNRRDGDKIVLDRAVPLVLEAGDDQQTWRVLAERQEPFGLWSATFAPTTARYLRLRSPRTTFLHLQGVEVHP